MMRSFAIAVTAVLLSGCGLGRYLSPGDSVSVTEAGRAQLCAQQAPEAAVQLFPSGVAVAQWQHQTGIDLQARELQPGRYALVQMGLRHTGGNGIAVSSDATRDGDTLNLYATFFSPRQGAITTQMLTSPCVLVQLPPGSYRTVDVYDQRGKLRASAAFEPAS